VFLGSALVFAAGGILSAALFPSKARLAAMRESVSPDAATMTAERHGILEIDPIEV
jgi:hypothetical protein